MITKIALINFTNICKYNLFFRKFTIAVKNKTEMKLFSLRKNLISLWF